MANIDSSRLEVAMQQLIMPTLILFHETVLHFLNERMRAAATKRNWTVFLAESAYYSISYQLVVTIAADYLWLAIVLPATLSILGLLLYRRPDKIVPHKNYQRSTAVFITWSRSWLFLATAICILGVDFSQFFPSRFGKTQVFGVSLMDTGVGWYVIVQAVTYSNAHTDEELQKCGASMVQRAQKSSSSRYAATIKWFRQTFSLFLLGVVRLVTIKAAMYNEHVIEYGVHWNFFFTLFFVKVFTSFLRKIPTRFYTATLLLISSSLLLVSEFFMHRDSSRDYLIEFYQNRSGFFGANREGLFSLMGYCALFCLSTYMARTLLIPYWKCAPERIVQEKPRLFVKVMAFSIVCFLISLASEYYLDPPSRRFANCAFVFWTLSLSIGMMSSLIAMEILLDRCHICLTYPLFLEVLAGCGLVHFLIANVCTGIVNMAFNPNFVQVAAYAEYLIAMYIMLTNFFAAFVSNILAKSVFFQRHVKLESLLV